MKRILALTVMGSLVSAPFAAAQNDECAGALPLALGSTPFSTIGSATSAPAWPCASGGSDIWYSFVSATSETIGVDTCGSGYDTALEVFGGSCGSLQSLACNDDACGLQSSVSWSATAGTTYYIRVGGFSGETGSGTLNVAGVQGLSNDDCSNAVPIQPGSTPFSTLGASTSSSWPCALGGTDIWYTFVAGGGTVVFDTCGSGYDTALELFEGDCASLMSIACNDDSCGLQSTVSAQVTAGLTYHLRVGGYSGGAGTGVLNFTGMTGMGQLGSNYCTAATNSSGQAAELSAEGSILVADNDVTLTASGLPQDRFALFLNSQQQGSIPFPGGSQGTLCLSGGIARYLAPGEVMNSGADGEVSLVLDLGETPTMGGPPVAIAAGETWFFQVWYRDENPGMTSNFTDGLQIDFQ